MRRAGSGRLPDGRRVTWTVADGTRGRRWRSTTSDAEGLLILSLLAEVAPDGSLSKLEAASPSGLLTLHPERGTLHGNVVRAAGIEHLAHPFPDDGVVLVDGSPVTASIAAAALAELEVGEGTGVGGVAVGEDLAVRIASWRATRNGAFDWRVEERPAGAVHDVRLDADGVPQLAAAVSWMLEIGHESHG